MAVVGQYSKNSVRLNKARKELRVTGLMGWRIHPITGEDDWHNANDYSIPQGTQLTSVLGGEVTINVKSNSGYGNHVGVYNKDQNVTLIQCHMSRNDVTVGSQITYETVIGLSGGQKGVDGSGSSTGPHLHPILVKGRHTSIPNKSDHSIYLDLETYDFGGGGGSVDPVPTKEIITVVTKDTNIRKEFKMGDKYEVTNVKGDQITLTKINEGFKVGSKVRINKNAKKWSTGQNIPEWAKGRTYTVVESNSVKTLLGDGIKSWINNSDLTQV